MSGAASQRIIMTIHNDRISIQVGLSGYSFKIWADGNLHSSGWMGADRIFTAKELQRRYDVVDISVFTPKCTLVPSNFFSPERAAEMLADVVAIGPGDPVDYVEIPHLASVLVYSDMTGGMLTKVLTETVRRPDGSKSRPRPELYYMLEQLPDLQDYNKILASYMDGYLYLTIAQGKSLLLCNTYAAADFTTAEYFLFLAMKKLQLNPEVSTVFFRTPLLDDQEMSLYRYFNNVEQL